MRETSFRKGIPHKLNEEKVIEIFKLAKTNSSKAIAKIMNVSLTTIYKVLKGASWRHVKNESISRYSGTAIKIDEQTVFFIRAFKNDKRQVGKEYAKKIGISSSSFSRIKNRRSRKNV